MKFLTFILLTFITFTGWAAESFDTEVEAAISALRYYHPISQETNKSYLGAIYQKDGKYVVIHNTANSLTIPAGTRLVAFWHTHGKRGNDNHLFSDKDTAIVHKVGKPMYLSDPNKRVKVFRPTHTTIKRYRGRLGTGFGKGEFVKDSNNVVLYL